MGTMFFFSKSKTSVLQIPFQIECPSHVFLHRDWTESQSAKTVLVVRFFSSKDQNVQNFTDFNFKMII